MDEVVVCVTNKGSCVNVGMSVSAGVSATDGIVVNVTGLVMDLLQADNMTNETPTIKK
jgi:hypothetical protein